jgi:succinyl-diaminopimelate desuccinylase
VDERAPIPREAAADARDASPDLVRQDLVTRLLEHCAFVCPTGEEGPIADAMVARYAQLDEAVVRVGHSVVVGEPGPRWRGRDGGDRPLVLLVGHLDVVPPTDADRDPRVERHLDGEVVVARGASDMKAGNVIAMRAFEDPALRAASPYDLVLVLYAGEEGPADGNELAAVLEAVPWLAQADLAIVLEPTDGEVQLGCLGSLQAEVVFRGRQAHSARPWHGRNALTLAGGFLTELDTDHVQDVEVDGIAFRDVWSATQAWTPGLGPGERGTAVPVRNVIPGAFTLNLNLRFAPSRTTADAERMVHHRVGDRAEVTIVDRAPAAPPHRDELLVAAFVASVDAPVTGKQAWTDVARFAEVGVPALNYGPGLTAQAHQRGEFVPVDAVVDASRRLERFLRGGAGPHPPQDEGQERP